MISPADRKKGKQRYRELTALVGAVIREWDPGQLLAGGAPLDEYDVEIARIVANVPRIHSPGDAIAMVSRVFVSSFGQPGFVDDKDCAAVGERLFALLLANDFV